MLRCPSRKMSVWPSLLILPFTGRSFWLFWDRPQGLCLLDPLGDPGHVGRLRPRLLQALLHQVRHLRHRGTRDHLHGHLAPDDAVLVHHGGGHQGRHAGEAVIVVVIVVVDGGVAGGSAFAARRARVGVVLADVLQSDWAGGEAVGAVPPPPGVDGAADVLDVGRALEHGLLTPHGEIQGLFFSHHLGFIWQKIFLSPVGPLFCGPFYIANFRSRFSENQGFLSDLLKKEATSFERILPEESVAQKSAWKLISSSSPWRRISPALVGQKPPWGFFGFLFRTTLHHIFTRKFTKLH